MSQGKFFEQLQGLTEERQSCVCLGLDPAVERLPVPFPQRPGSLLPFLKAIVDATSDVVAAYKPQIAFYAALGAEKQLEELIDYIHSSTRVPVILDAKRGDIDSTAKAYAAEAFVRYEVDAVTVNPYLGGDSLAPFTRFQEKGIYVLCRTSNPGGADLQHRQEAGRTLYEQVAALAAGSWNTHGNLGLVVGATRPDELARVRSIAPRMPLLVPGAGAQGADMSEAAAANQGGPWLVNSSRGILYASSGRDFAEAARNAAESLRNAIRGGG